MKRWKNVIGFSGTIIASVSSQLRLEFKESSIIMLKSMRKNNLENEIT
jgi:hypothetical protein